MPGQKHIRSIVFAPGCSPELVVDLPSAVQTVGQQAEYCFVLRGTLDSRPPRSANGSTQWPVPLACMIVCSWGWVLSETLWTGAEQWRCTGSRGSCSIWQFVEADLVNVFTNWTLKTLSLVLSHLTLWKPTGTLLTLIEWANECVSNHTQISSKSHLSKP